MTIGLEAIARGLDLTRLACSLPGHLPKPWILGDLFDAQVIPETCLSVSFKWCGDKAQNRCLAEMNKSNTEHLQEK